MKIWVKKRNDYLSSGEWSRRMGGGLSVQRRGQMQISKRQEKQLFERREKQTIWSCRECNYSSGERNDCSERRTGIIGPTRKCQLNGQWTSLLLLMSMESNGKIHRRVEYTMELRDGILYTMVIYINKSGGVTVSGGSSSDTLAN